jgi:hypothetical protein
MTVRKIAGTLGVLMAFVALQPLSAQKQTGYQWTADRPDAHGPVSLTEDRTLSGGEFQLSVKFVNDRFKGMGLGSDSLTLNQVLNAYTVAPTEMFTRGAEVNLMVGITEHLTLSATGTFVQKKMDMAVLDPDEANLVWVGNTDALGPEDVEVTALYNVVDRGPVRIHFQGGVSIPIGAIDFDDETVDPRQPGSSTVEVQLPYQQQLGSGTFDILPGVTATVQNRLASMGFQAKAVIRMGGENDRGWALGDIYTGTVWGAYKASDNVSVSVGARYTTWGNVEGFDEALLTSTSTAYDTPAYNGLQSGSRVEIPMGVNFMVSEGRFQGHRFGVEFLLPVHQELDYLQFRRDWSLVMGWQKAMDFF